MYEIIYNIPCFAIRYSSNPVQWVIQYFLFCVFDVHLHMNSAQTYIERENPCAAEADVCGAVFPARVRYL